MAQSCTDAQDPFHLSGRTFIVTGGGSGIGLCTVEHLLSRGSSVVVLDLDVDAVALLDGDVSAVQGDATIRGVAEDALAAALDRGGLDGVVFAAGTSSTGPLAELPLESFDRDIAQNLTAHLPLSQAVLRYRAEHPADAQCSLVYVASKHAVAPSSGFGGYPVAKGAMLQMARVFALEGARLGVRANVVNPGAVFDGSNFWQKHLSSQKAAAHGVSIEDLPDFYADRTLLGVRVAPADVAHSIQFLLSPLSRATTGATISVDGGLAASFGR